MAERISLRAGSWLFAPLVALGVWSIVHWRVTEEAGRGDLRFYGLLQCFTMLAVPVMVLLFPPRYSKGRGLFLAAAIYGAAKVFELLDAPIHQSGGWVSGHTLKHLMAGLAAWTVLAMVRARRPLPEPEPAPIAVDSLGDPLRAG